MLKKISEKQEKVLSYYKKYITHHKKSPTYEEASDELKINPSAIYKHVQNLVDLGYIQKDEAGKLFVSENFDKIPLLGEIACGNPLTVYEKVNEAIEVPKSMLNGLGSFYALKAKGTSMEGANIFEGDVLIIRQQDDVNDGEIGVLIISENGEESATLKTIFHTQQGILAKPQNSRFPKMIVDKKNALIRGKLVGIISQF